MNCQRVIKQMADCLSIVSGGGLYHHQDDNPKKERNGSKSYILIKNQEKIEGVKSLNRKQYDSLNVNYYYKIIFKGLLLFIAAGMMLLFNTGLANADSSTAKIKKTHKIAEITSQQILTKTKKALREMNKILTPKKIFKSTQTAAVLNRKGMKQAQDTGGGAVQAL